MPPEIRAAEQGRIQVYTELAAWARQTHPFSKAILEERLTSGRDWLIGRFGFDLANGYAQLRDPRTTAERIKAYGQFRAFTRTLEDLTSGAIP